MIITNRSILLAFDHECGITGLPAVSLDTAQARGLYTAWLNHPNPNIRSIARQRLAAVRRAERTARRNA